MSSCNRFVGQELVPFIDGVHWSQARGRFVKWRDDLMPPPCNCPNLAFYGVSSQTARRDFILGGSFLFYALGRAAFVSQGGVPWMCLMGAHILWPPSHVKKTYERCNQGRY